MKFFKKKKVITRVDGIPYLIRRTLFECSWFAIKIHDILISDDDCMHDHPWAFVSIILKHGYVEHLWRVKDSPYKEKYNYYIFGMEPTQTKTYKPGSILFRNAADIHRLEVNESKPAKTLVITFKKIRTWGFWTMYGFIPWFDYSHQEHC